MKRLYRNKNDVMIAGVCSGLAEYIDVDPTVVRLVFVLLLFMGFSGFWIYLVLWFTMPEKPAHDPQTIEVNAMKKTAIPKTTTASKQPAPKSASDQKAPKSQTAKVTPKVKTAAKKEPEKKPEEKPTAKTTPASKSTVKSPTKKASAKAKPKL